MAVERNVGWHLWQALLKSEHRTTNGREADYFFIPVFPMGTVSLGVALAALEEVVHRFPWWNATRGFNHLMVGAYDFGLCQISGLPFFERIRMISHFGHLGSGKYFCHAPIGGPSYRPGIDLLVPDTMEMLYKFASPYLTGNTQARPTTFFFAGNPTGIWRSKLFAMNLTQSGYRIFDHHVDLGREMASAQFCGDFGAGGFSTRFALAVVSGCIPVFLDELRPAWSDVMPIDDFAIRLSKADFLRGRLPSVVAAVTPERMAQLQDAGRAVWTRYVWAFMGMNVTHDAFELFISRLALLV
jgi:hypothetical protein